MTSQQKRSWTKALDDFAPRAGLEPALVVKVGEKDARRLFALAGASFDQVGRHQLGTRAAA